MALYAYKARDETGKTVKGTMSAASNEALADKLKKMGYLATSVKEIPPGITLEGFFEKLKRVTPDQIVMFNIQLAKMIKAGLPLLRSLETLTEQTENKKLREALEVVSRDIKGGNSFSSSLEKHRRIFSDLFVNMVRAGEASGRLEEVLARMATYTEKQADLRQRVKTALTYPAVLIIVGLLVSIFIVVFVLPKFMAIFFEARVPLPLPTLILYKISQFIRGRWYWLIIAILAFTIVIRQYVKSPAGRLQFDRLKLKLPIIGPLIRKVAISRFSNTLATLLSSGVPILGSLEIVERTCGNLIISRVVKNVYTSVDKGESMAEPLKVSNEFPPMIVQMVAVGEETGALDEMLAQIADFYDVAVDYSIKRLTALIEPVFLIIMAGLAGFIMASLLLPLFRMVRLIG